MALTQPLQRAVSWRSQVPGRNTKPAATWAPSRTTFDVAGDLSHVTSPDTARMAEQLRDRVLVELIHQGLITNEAPPQIHAHDRSVFALGLGIRLPESTEPGSRLRRHTLQSSYNLNACSHPCVASEREKHIQRGSGVDQGTG